MTKFWMTTMVAIMFGLTTGCPDEVDDTCTGEGCICGDGTCNWNEDCATCPEDCAFMCADADADADSDTSEDSATDEVANCPNVAGDWDLTYRENESGMESYHPLTLEQDGCLVFGWDDSICDYTGTISVSGYISLYRDCPSRDRTVTGTFTQTPSRMEGDWHIEESPPLHGTWWADPQ